MTTIDWEKEYQNLLKEHRLLKVDHSNLLLEYMLYRCERDEEWAEIFMPKLKELSELLTKQASLGNELH